MGEILDKKLIDYFFTDNYPFFISDTNVLNCLIYKKIIIDLFYIKKLFW